MLEVDTKPVVIVTVSFSEELAQEVQGTVIMEFEKHLRALTGRDCRVFKKRMGDDSKLRVMMTQKQREAL